MLSSTLGYSFVQVISELAKSSTIMNIENTDLKEADRTARQNTQTTTCGITDKTSSCAKTNSNTNDESVEPQSCDVQSIDCSETGDSSSIDSQCCTDINHSANEQYYNKDCSECQIVRRDPTANELTMCLHALSYKVSWTLLCIIKQ